MLTDLQALNFVDKIGGVVYPFQQKRMGEGGQPVIKTIPIYGNNPTVCVNEPYIDLVPDDRYKSVVYFEADNENMVTEATHQGQVTTIANLTMIGWFNMPKINASLTSAEGMIRAMTSVVLGVWDITGAHCVVEVTGFRYRDPSIFSEYTYDEAEKQYLIYPFDFGAVEFEVQMTYDICDDEPEISPDCYNT